MRAAPVSLCSHGTVSSQASLGWCGSRLLCLLASALSVSGGCVSAPATYVKTLLLSTPKHPFLAFYWILWYLKVLITFFNHYFSWFLDMTRPSFDLVFLAKSSWSCSQSLFLSLIHRHIHHPSLEFILVPLILSLCTLPMSHLSKLMVSVDSPGACLRLHFGLLIFISHMCSPTLRLHEYLECSLA